jgi:hypothetical protein
MAVIMPTVRFCMRSPPEDLLLFFFAAAVEEVEAAVVEDEAAAVEETAMSLLLLLLELAALLLLLSLLLLLPASPSAAPALLALDELVSAWVAPSHAHNVGNNVGMLHITHKRTEMSSSLRFRPCAGAAAALRAALSHATLSQSDMNEGTRQSHCDHIQRT